MNATVNFDFHNQRMIVTGGTRGIGGAITLAFLQAGATVIATYAHNDDEAQRFRANNALYGERLDIQKFDVTQLAQVKSFFSGLEEKYSSVEVLVNNSGIRADALLATMSPEQFQKVLDTNLTGTFYMAQAAVLSFLKNRYGRIINISSVGGKICLPGQANYAASKAGQMALAQSLAKEVARKGITVNSVAPGFIETDLIKDLPEELKKQYLQDIPCRRFGRAEEVAYAVCFLAARESSYINGATLEVAGGLS